MSEHPEFWIGKPRVESKVKVLLYGPSGSGKTRLAGTFPKPIFIDFEDGMISVQGEVGRYPADPKKKVESWEQVRHVFNLLKSGNHPFETVVIDSLNEMLALLTDHVVKNFSGIQKRNYGDVPSMADYSKITLDFRRAIRMFIQLPYNIVCICANKDRDKETDLVEPMLVGKTSKDIVRFFDLVGFMVVRKGDDNRRDYSVSFAYHPEYVTKDRYGTFPPLVPAHWDDIQSYMEEGDNGED